MITPTEFRSSIESLVKSDNMTYIEAILQFCSDRGIDPGDIKPLIDKSMKDRLKVEGQDINLLKTSLTTKLF